MNILILGTSNSILKEGWVRGLAQALPGARIDNRSVGASPAVQFTLAIGLDFSAYDYVVLDSVPNDEVYSDLPGYEHRPAADAALFQLASTIAAETELILLGISDRNYLHPRSGVIEDRQSVACATGAQFVDFRALLLEYGDRLIRSPEHRYEEHPSHPAMLISRTFGEALGRVLRRNGRRSGSARGGTDFRANFSRWSVDDPDVRLPRKTFSNRLMTQTFAVLAEGDSLEFSGEDVVLGYYMNRHDTHADIVLTDDRGDTLTVTSRYPRRPGKLLKTFVPVPGHFRLKTLSIAAGAHGPAIRSLLAPDDVDPASMPVSATISDVAFWNGAGPVGDATPACSPGTELVLHGEVDALLASGLRTRGEQALIANVRRAILERRDRAGPIALHSHHRTIPVLDLRRDRSIHVAPADMLPHQLPISLRHRNGKVEPVVSADGIELALMIHKSGLALNRRHDPGEEMLGTAFDVEETGDTRIALRCGDHYLTAERKGAIVCNRTRVQLFETFELRAL